MILKKVILIGSRYQECDQHGVAPRKETIYFMGIPVYTRIVRLVEQEIVELTFSNSKEPQ